MLKRILAGSALALGLIGCGGSGGGGGTSFVYGVNAVPNVGAVSITAAGSVVLNNAAYSATSSAFVGVSAGTDQSIFLTNSSNTQLASGLTNFTSGDYYTTFAIGNSVNQYVFVYPTDVSAPASGTAKLSFVNSSILQPSVDVYVALQGSTTLGSPVITSMTPFTSGQEISNLVAGQSYTVQFNVSGTSVSLGSTTITTGTTPASNEIQLLAIVDSQTGVTPAQTILTPIPIPVVAGATTPSRLGHATVVGHPNMTSFPK